VNVERMIPYFWLPPLGLVIATRRFEVAMNGYRSNRAYVDPP